MATGCRVEITEGGSTFDLRQNKGLGSSFKEIFESQFGIIDYIWGIKSASTDFVSIRLVVVTGGMVQTLILIQGNVTYGMNLLPHRHRATRN